MPHNTQVNLLDMFGATYGGYLLPGTELSLVLRVYSGVMPVANGPVTTQMLLVEYVGYPRNLRGSATGISSYDDIGAGYSNVQEGVTGPWALKTASGSGTATWFRIIRRSDSVVMLDGNVGVFLYSDNSTITPGDLLLTTTTITAGDIVGIYNFYANAGQLTGNITKVNLLEMFAGANSSYVAGVTLKLYSGVQPSDCGVAVSTQTLFATFPGFPANFVGTQDSVYAVGGSTASAVATGTITWFRIFRNSDSLPILDGSVGLTDADVILDKAAVTVGDLISIRNFTVAQV